jgi:Tol biopolymer transport system component
MAHDAVRWRRLESVVQAALERPTGERAAYLAEACGDDEDLRREAASLIEREAHAGAFLAAPLGALAADAMTYSPGGTPLDSGARIAPGSRIGAYEVRDRLGAGGMGEVYRARDHVLHRDVALKLLPLAFSADRDRLARFEREARLLASLNHPHIGAVYGLEGSGDQRAIVLELIDGETLEARLRRGPLPVSQAIGLTIQVADALDHAHRRGVMHRDLKPANIMLTKTGAKLLDFGLAKWSVRPSGYLPESNVHPTTRPDGEGTLTEKGTILGTLHYMAPEQLEGRVVDGRADVFAFGAVLYEVLTGRKAFDGGSAPAVMAAVLNAEPDLGALQQVVSPAVQRLARKCLAKDPDERWQSARDLADELRWIAVEPAQAAGPTASAMANPGARPVRDDRRWHRAAAAAAAGVILVTVAWVGGTKSGGPVASVPIVNRFAVQPTIATSLDWFDVSPDGREIAFTGSQQPGREPQLFVRRLDEFEETAVAGTEGAFFPFYSPDGEWIGMSIGNRLVKVQVRTGATPLTLCECVDRQRNNGTAWLDDGSIVFTRDGRGLLRVSSNGGEPSELTTLRASPQEVDHHAPSPLPGGRALLFTSHGAAGTFDVEAVRLDTGERRVLVKSAYDARYLSSGHLVYARAGAILAAPFDVGRLEATGPAVTLVERVASNPSIGGNPSTGSGEYHLSPAGTLVYRAAASQDGRTLTWVTPAGQETPVPLAPRAFSSPRVSPDGTRLAFAAADGGRRDIWTYELATQRLARLTREGDNKTPLWSRDGRRLAYSSNRDGTPRIWMQPADGSGAPEAIVAGKDNVVPASWTAGDRSLVYVHVDSGAARSAVVAVSGDRRSEPLVSDEIRAPAVSPDGRWIAFTATDSRFTEVHVASFPNGPARQQISVGSGRQPLWRRDGRELVYRAGPRMFSVAVDPSGGFRWSAPVLLFERPYVVGGPDVMGIDYDLAPDGRLLMIRPSPAELRTNSVNVVVNWIEEVKQRVRPHP